VHSSDERSPDQMSVEPVPQKQACLTTLPPLTHLGLPLVIDGLALHSTTEAQTTNAAVTCAGLGILCGWQAGPCGVQVMRAETLSKAQPPAVGAMLGESPAPSTPRMHRCDPTHPCPSEEALSTLAVKL
jgi:hypothetical protein